jgi:N-acetylneuraminic acid mutarotase
MARFRPTATLLPTGQVLVTGGASDAKKAELYDPATGKWRITANLLAARNGHTATLLPDGSVLIVGGANGGDSRTGIAQDVFSAERYDPAVETWRTVAAPGNSFLFQSSVLLPDGRLLIIGLRSHASYVLHRDCTKLAQLYDPASGAWSTSSSSPTRSCSLGWDDHTTAVLLANGLVLVTGFGSAELFDPATGDWKVTAAPTGVGTGHTLTLLANGQVLATGGHRWDASVSDAELYDPNSETWTATVPLTKTRAGHAASLLFNGKVLITGGFDGGCCDWRDTLSTTDLFDIMLPGN